MKMSNLLMPTLKEVPAEAEIKSHQLMLRAGLMRKVAAGIYAYLPLGLRSLKKVEQIIREEMDAHGAQELLMPALLPSETYQASGRWDVFGPEMFRLQDRGGRDFCLGPTHEEIFTQTVRSEVKSYRSLPLTLYQIQTKYRDERRPRFGVMRSREFIMKDAYSFDKDALGLDVSYTNMYHAYCAAFDRMGMNYIAVDADSGAMGGSGSQEFMVKSEVGEAVIAYCDICGFAANDEKAPCVPQKIDCPPCSAEKKQVHTPGVRTIDQLMQFLSAPASLFVKTLIYKADDAFVAVLLRGDRELNETKLQNHLGCAALEMACAEDVAAITGAAVGFAGPIGLAIDVLADLEIELMQNFICGANQTDFHFENVNIGKDFTPKAFVDLRNIADGDCCPKCGGLVHTAGGIEVGHIFKLGTKYSKALDCTFLDEEGKPTPMVMGCYGIGVNRCMAAVIEQNCDENGIVWPASLAPFHVLIVCVNIADDIQRSEAEKLYHSLRGQGIEVLLDDRDERAGVKFKDADLIGIPVRITVGRKASEGIVEYKLRSSGEVSEMSLSDAEVEAVKFIKRCL